VVAGVAIATAGRDLVVYGGERWTGPADGHLLGDAWWWTPPT